MKSALHNAAPFLTLSTVLACGEAPAVLDLGDTQPPEQLGASLVDFAGVWEGYIEAYTLVDGSDIVRLRVAADGSGSFEVGDAPTPELDIDDPTGALVGYGLQLLPGYHYPLAGARVENGRMRLGVPVRKPADQWCTLFKNPVLDRASGGYVCRADTPAEPHDQLCRVNPEPNPLSACGPEDCLSICKCDADACSIDTIGSLEETSALLDAALEDDGDKLVGTLRLAGDRRLVLRMLRM